MQYQQMTLTNNGLIAQPIDNEPVIDNEFLLQDRIQKIQQVINQYGEDNFAISFSGGKDSTVLSALIDLALPDNKIPRLYANTGIELNMIRDFVFEMQKQDDRIIVLTPKVPIKQMLEREGYPFKSKQHAKWVDAYQRNGQIQSIENYTASDKRDKDLFRTCPKVLLYQFNKDFNLRISDKCCQRLKEDPLNKWQKDNNKPYAIIGVMREEGGRRAGAQCLAFHGDKLHAFQPLAPMSKDWEEWFISSYNVKICDIYYPPYNFVRTGCKGCPFALYLQEELDTLDKFFPNEKKQCELIWAPVYAEYRRLGYRLKPIKNEQLEGQMSIFDYNLGGCVNE